MLPVYVPVTTPEIAALLHDMSTTPEIAALLHDMSTHWYNRINISSNHI